jgi:uncharacterized membrane protein
MTFWSLAHLLSNGELRSVILFAGFAVWALITMPFISHRDGAYEPPAIENAQAEIKYLVIALIVVAVLVATHGFYTGESLIS